MTATEQTRQEYVAQLAEWLAPHFGVRPADILGNRRKNAMAQPRHLLMWKCREQGWTVTAIAALTDRDHSTVSEGSGKIGLRLASDRELRELAEAMPDFEGAPGPLTNPQMLRQRLLNLRAEAARIIEMIDERLPQIDSRQRSLLATRAS